MSRRIPQVYKNKRPHRKRPSSGEAAGAHVPAGSYEPGALSWAWPCILLSLTIWAYWNSLTVMAHCWNHDVQYSHGYLVPLFSAGLLWSRRAEIGSRPLVRDWRGLLLIFSGISLRIGGALIYSEWIDNVSLLVVCAGIVVLCGGGPALRWSWTAILFLFFMIPLPYTIDVALRNPLRTIGTTASTYLLQTLGISAFAEGHVISVAGEQIGVAEACSGMRMTMIFFALATAVALTIRRTRLERLLIVASAVPIAVAVNIARITVTGLLHATGQQLLASWFFHDLAGWLMMPLALVLLQCELYYLKRLLVVETDAPMTAGLTAERAGQKAARSDGILTVA